jgi:hypothetical protein
MMARIGNKLIAICSAAIGIIYAAGYVVTDSAAVHPILSAAAMSQPAPTLNSATPQPILSETAIFLS